MFLLNIYTNMLSFIGRTPAKIRVYLFKINIKFKIKYSLGVVYTHSLCFLDALLYWAYPGKLPNLGVANILDGVRRGTPNKRQHFDVNLNLESQ